MTRVIGKSSIIDTNISDSLRQTDIKGFNATKNGVKFLKCDISIKSRSETIDSKDWLIVVSQNTRQLNALTRTVNESFNNPRYIVQYRKRIIRKMGQEKQSLLVRFIYTRFHKKRKYHTISPPPTTPASILDANGSQKPICK